ncbi:MAG TPA: hypothetical protein VG944_00935 [Fimbriimonas sp.]|nr:hypothetical protein [Fimbriimonas sp.]
MQNPLKSSKRRRLWVYVLAVLLAAGLCAAPLVRRRLLFREMAALYFKSLIGVHLTDVHSSDPHEVLLGLENRLGFVPVIPSRTPPGYSLVGGRVDVFETQQACVFVYKRGRDYVEVLVTPFDVGTSGPHFASRLNYLGWSAGSLHYWAMTYKAQYLDSLARAFQESGPPLNR